MQIERQISLFGVLMGAAFALPETYFMLTHPAVEPSGLFIFSGFLGAIGVLFGTLLAFVHPNYIVRNLGVVFWALVALAFAGAMLLGFMQSPGPVRRTFRSEERRVGKVCIYRWAAEH